MLDFDVHGLARVRVDGNARDASVIARQLGLEPDAPAEQPDIVVRFTDRLALDGPLTFVGPDAAHTDDVFLVLRGARKARVRAQIPFGDLGGPCELVCERGLTEVPLLLAILNLTVLSNGALPLHASAFVHDGRGVLVTGWSKGGKTETLLAFTDRGASYVGDEWVYLAADGETMLGIPEPIRIWGWQLEHMPRLRSAVPRLDRVRLRALDTAVSVLRRRDRGMAPRLAALLDAQANVRVPAARLFGGSATALRARCDTVLFVTSGEAPAIAVRNVAPETVASRMASSLEEERAELLSYYRRFRFAFPHAVNAILESAPQLERKLLDSWLGGRSVLHISHPYPVRIPALYDALHSVLP